MRFTLFSISFCLFGLGKTVAVPASGTKDLSLARRTYGTDTYSDQLTDGTACRDVTVIYARGTGQSGNIGETTDVGPEYLNYLATYVGSENLAVAGVNYSADILGFEEGGDPAGSQTMADLATLVGIDSEAEPAQLLTMFLVQAFTQCPDTLLVLSGYSQGAQLVHNSAKLISSAVTNFVSAGMYSRSRLLIFTR